jgi:hypothetical protein
MCGWPRRRSESRNGPWRLLSQAVEQSSATTGWAPYQLSEADREAYARYRGDVAAAHRVLLGCAGQPGRAEFGRRRRQ